MKNKTALLILVALTPLISWGIYSVLYPIAVRCNSVEGLSYACVALPVMAFGIMWSNFLNSIK